jgi:phage gp46-like protein
MTLGLVPVNDKPYPLDLDFNQERDDLEQAVYLSLFCNKREISPEIANQNLPENGWFGNLDLYQNDFEQGSFLWTLSQSEINDQVINLAISYIEESLDWLIEDNIVEDFEVNFVNEVNQVIESYEQGLAITKQSGSLRIQIKFNNFLQNSKELYFTLKLNG